MRRDLPTGTVTFLFTDVEGSTKLLHELGAGAYADALREHRRLIREACAAEGGVEVDTQGDAFFFVFASAPGALAAASAFTDALTSGPIQVRVGLHTGSPLQTEEGYVGEDVHFAARVAATSHGGQVVLSKAAAELVQAELKDLGEHRVKDVPDAVAIYQLGTASFPPLKTISNTNLPRPASSFVGREAELEAVLERIEAGARLLTLTGPGGCGKTRLALEATATLVPEYKAGVFWVALASIRDPALVPETISQTLGAKDGLAEHIGEREMLVLLDNLEQVIEAAPALASLVEACHNLALLVTSRELLRIRGEVEYPVPPLASPEAVALFCERSGLEPSEEIADLCARLDNLPLAVELAAARVKALSPRQILERLSQRLDLLKGRRDADPRQETLRATIEWSYDLLPAEEQRLFARLSVFSGGCTLEAAEEVADADLDALQSLVEKNLLRHTGERFWMLQTIHDFAAERLKESTEAKGLRRRHAEHFLELAAGAEPHLRSGSPSESLDRLEREHDNLRGAFDALAAAGETQGALQLGAALWKFWDTRGHGAEGRRRLASAQRADESPTAARARALDAAGALSGNAGDFRTATLHLDEARALYRRLGDAWGIAHADLSLGALASNQGDLASAQEIYEKSVETFRELGDDYYMLWAMRMLAWICDRLGDWERSQALNEEVVRQARIVGNEPMLATSLGALGGEAIQQGRVNEGIAMLKESTRIYRQQHDFFETAVNLSRFARALALEARPNRAARLLACSEVLFEKSGKHVDEWVLSPKEETLAMIREQLDEAAVTEAWRQGRNLTANEAVELAFDSFN